MVGLGEQRSGRRVDRFSRAIEGIQVVYTAKGTAAPGATDVPLRVGKVPTLSYRGHVQSIGWQPWVTDGAMIDYVS